MKNYIMITIINLVIIGCAVYEPLPGLCYTDKTGTYLCPKENPLKSIPDYDRNFNCMNNFYNEELWIQCMNPNNDHIWDPYYKERRDFEREIIEQERLRQIESRIENIA